MDTRRRREATMSEPRRWTLYRTGKYVEVMPVSERDRDVYEWEKAYDILAERLRQAEADEPAPDPDGTIARLAVENAELRKVTDEMVMRAMEAFITPENPVVGSDDMRRALMAALRPPE
jgi:hypothetical protein